MPPTRQGNLRALSLLRACGTAIASQDRVPESQAPPTLQSRTGSKRMKKKQERELLKSLEHEEIELKSPSMKLLRELEEAAEGTFKKDKRINIRLSSHDLLGIQRKASQKGIPYQALISALIHQYVEGDLIPKQ